MTPRDVAGIFNPYFVIGFFLPSFFVLMAGSQLLSADMLPNGYEGYGDGTRVLILGGLALLIGLILSGLRSDLWRLLEGAFLTRAIHIGEWSWVPGKPLNELLVSSWRRNFDQLRTTRDSDDNDERRTTAALTLDKWYPASKDRIMPTRFGNIVGATRAYPFTRWGLDSAAISQRIEMLLTPEQIERQDRDMTDGAFLVNACVGIFALGLALLADGLFVGGSGWRVFGAFISFMAGYVFYRQAVGARHRLARLQRAAIDLHRLDLYRQLGVKVPATQLEERNHAEAINLCLLYGVAIPSEFMPDSEAADPQS
jgi:hypothetical protein